MALDDRVIERRLTKLRLAGPELSHSRQNNVEAVKRLVQGDPYVTFGIHKVLEYVRSDGVAPDDVHGIGRRAWMIEGPVKVLEPILETA